MAAGTTRPILLIEDNPDDADLTVHALESHGVRNAIVIARDGADALRKLFGGSDGSGAMPELPALILLDLNLPKVNGLEVLRRIRGDARTSLLPVVVLTSSREQRDLIESYELGANSYVRKPVDFDEFREAARALSTYWLVLNEAPPLPGDGAKRR